MSKKPTVRGPFDGNIFSIMGACTSALKKADMKQEAKELTEKVMNSGSYSEALNICRQYVVFKI